eukprot:CAMPEP_0173404390 /NCGR_PEP_ID=MMETSP1356-20130122/59255_1 /TAXON_ID=77927 ORGANISM="Hemiselmis virescens, Strain PCC157" /NCGR_SAMPLE_ID=MMETSP1356 /ASSEMBLY_ACC=CAM_ASM_000847 /LENGTH=58 /DNA_ID=CAMNT_0014365059 /DNA_START=17 /DNA_END=189 /DNA_ORIENTATION=+
MNTTSSPPPLTFANLTPGQAHVLESPGGALITLPAGAFAGAVNLVIRTVTVSALTPLP